ncbi:MAG: AAA family ATPase [Cypionkella sp.]|nr:AAA family ATPase [Cypionkella sp.]
MSNVAIIETLPSALVACTISRNIEEFEILIDAMEETFGESWGDIPFDDALPFLQQTDSAGLRFMVIAVNAADEADLDRVADIVAQGKARGLGVIALSDTISPAALHKVMRSGADDFLPYPLPDDAFDQAIARLEDKFAAEAAAKVAATVAQAAPPPPAASAEVFAPSFKPKGDRDGVILPVHGLAGGVGASTLAVNLAHEMALIGADTGARVCLLDFDFQFGNVATYLDLPRRDAVMDFLSDAALSDSEAMLGAMQTTKEGLHVLTSPTDMMPLEIVTAQDVGHVLDMARANFDYVIIDMPTTIVSWTEAVLARAHVYFGVVALDLRSAQNVLRLLRALKAEGLPHEKLRFALNRAPGFTDLAAKARVKRMAESLDIAIELLLPEGGAPIAQAGDQGEPLAQTAPKNALRREIQKLAKSLIDVNTAASAPAKAKR